MGISPMGMNLQLPSAVSIASEKQGLTLRIDKDNKIWMEQTEMTMEQIQPIVEQLMLKNPKTQIYFLADKTVAYDQVIQALDGVRLGGCFDIVLEAEKRDLDLPRVPVQ